MDITFQINFTGNGNGSTFDIYQDSDNYSVAVYTNQAYSTYSTQQTLTGISPFTKTIRLVDSGPCNVYRDLHINFNDPTPSITTLLDHAVLAKQYSLVSNGKDEVFAGRSLNTTLYLTKSTDNGLTWGSEITVPNAWASGGTNNSYDFGASMVFDGTYYYACNYWSTGIAKFDSSGTLIEQISLGLAISGIYNIHYINKKFYAFVVNSTSGNLELLRGNSFDQMTSLITASASYFEYANENMICNYGQVLYMSNGNQLYKSTDNGSSWVITYSPGATSSIKSMLIGNDENEIYLSVGYAGNYYIRKSSDGGSTFSDLISVASAEAHAADLYRRADIVFFAWNDQFRWVLKSQLDLGNQGVSLAPLNDVNGINIHALCNKENIICVRPEASKITTFRYSVTT